MQRPDNLTEYATGFRQFSRFAAVGFSNFAISFAVFYLLYNYADLSGLFFGLFGKAGHSFETFIRRFGIASLDATLANIFGYGAGVLNSFVWNKFWTFKAKHATAIQFGRFLSLNIFCLVSSSAVLFLFTDVLAWAYLPVWFAAMGAVTIVNFLLSKYWVFAGAES